jgi:hypothetical protein
MGGLRDREALALRLLDHDLHDAPSLGGSQRPELAHVAHAEDAVYL